MNFLKIHHILQYFLLTLKKKDIRQQINEQWELIGINLKLLWWVFTI